MDITQQTTPQAMTKAEAIHVLISHGQGQSQHIYAGLCPDEVTGPHARDMACPVCQALAVMSCDRPHKPAVGQRYSNGVDTVTVAQSMGGSYRLDQYPNNGMVYVPWFRSVEDLAEYLAGWQQIN